MNHSNFQGKKELSIFKQENNETLIKRVSALQFIQKIKHIYHSNGGAVAVEFSFMLPVLLIMYLGLSVTVIGIEIDNKLSLATETMGSLTARTTSVSDAELLQIFNASTYLMTPYPSTPLKLKVGSLVNNLSGIVKCWGANLSYASGAPSISSAFPSDLAEMGIPENVMPPESSLIVVEASYVYEPITTYFFPNLTLTKKFFTRPRSSFEVTKSQSGSNLISCERP